MTVKTMVTRMTGMTMHNDQAVLDFQKKMLEPAGPQVFIFGHQDKYSSCQK